MPPLYVFSLVLWEIHAVTRSELPCYKFRGTERVPLLFSLDIRFNAHVMPNPTPSRSAAPRE